MKRASPAYICVLFEKILTDCNILVRTYSVPLLLVSISILHYYLMKHILILMLLIHAQIQSVCINLSPLLLFPYVDAVRLHLYCRSAHEFKFLTEIKHMATISTCSMRRAASSHCQNRKLRNATPNV